MVTGEYETFWRVNGRLYGVAGTLPRRGAGSNPGPFPSEVAFPQGLTIADAAGGLHFAIATDNTGQVWEWGDNNSNPALGNSDVPLQVPLNLSDGNGHNVLSMAASCGECSGDSIVSSVAVDYSGKVWVWDDTTGGIQGDGTAGSATVTTPIAVSIPNESITKVVMSDVVVALASDGTVWTWGGNGVSQDLGRSGSGLTPGQVTGLPANIIEVATGGGWSYALAANGDLYEWGLNSANPGFCPTTGWCPQATPVLLSGMLGLPAGLTILSITASIEASYAILSDGSLWAWGSNGEGLIGTGVDPVACPGSCSWDFGQNDNLTLAAVQIFPSGSNITKVFTGSADVFYVYAQTADGKLYSWGRNKTCDLGNGVCPLNSLEAAQYPNSWDVSTPTLVSPLTATYAGVPSPQCLAEPDAGSCWCSPEGLSGSQSC